eukprot:66669-Pelagomonas_calceolata.AAC.6
MVQMKKSAPISSHDSHPSPQAAPPSTFCQANISTGQNAARTTKETEVNRDSSSKLCPCFNTRQLQQQRPPKSQTKFSCVLKQLLEGKEPPCAARRKDGKIGSQAGLPNETVLLGSRSSSCHLTQASA